MPSCARWVFGSGLSKTVEIFCLVMGVAGSADAGQTYLALGDSITFGVGADDSTADISNGDRGYVKGYADYLAGISGGAFDPT